WPSSARRMQGFVRNICAHLNHREQVLPEKERPSGAGIHMVVAMTFHPAAAQPWESHQDGMINTVVPETKVPSHQGPDAQTVLSGLDIVTMAGAGPFNLSHAHFCQPRCTKPPCMPRWARSFAASGGSTPTKGSRGRRSRLGSSR